MKLSLMYALLLPVLAFIPLSSPAHVVLNEIMYNPQEEGTGYQWIELYSNSVQPVSLEGWHIQTAGTAFQTILTLPDITIHYNEFILIAGEYIAGADIYADLNLPNTDNVTAGVRLLSPDGYTDTVLYGWININNLPDDISSPGETFAPTTPPGYSLARIADGHDTDDNAKDWFACAIPTPGSPNVFPVDLSLEDLEILQIDDRIRISVRVINPSSITIPEDEATIRIFINNECQGFFPLPELLAEYYTTEYYFFDDLGDGYYLLEIRLLYQYDPYTENNIIQDSFIAGSSPLVLNELLFKETPENQEWVEIYNRGNVPIVMEEFYLEDAAETRTNFSGVIPPKSYMVICRHKEQFLEFYPWVEPESVIESTSWAILNNDRETLFIADSYDTVFDYTEYTAPATYPHDLSLERINPYDDESLWDRCIHPNMSTPAAPNSLLPLQYDLAIMEASNRVEGEQLLHTLTIESIGYQYLYDFRLECYAYYNEAEEGILIYEKHYTLPPDDLISFMTVIPTAEYTTFRYLVESDKDLDPSNNFAFSYFNNDALPVVVNEIMFRPYTGEPRWIELKVNGFYKYLPMVTLETERYIVDVPLTGQEYIILVNNPADSLFILDNYQIDDALILTGLTSIYVSGEELTIYDPSENIFEQFTYDPAWSSVRGVSAERINPLLPSREDNWAHSIHPAGATPGRKNSIYTPYIPVQTSLSLHPNPFSPYRGERTIISFELPERMNRVNCRIFDLKGRLVNSLIDQDIFAARGSMIWDGTRDDGKTLPVGVYIIQLEATGSDSETVFREQSTVVIGR